MPLEPIRSRESEKRFDRSGAIGSLLNERPDVAVCGATRLDMNLQDFLPLRPLPPLLFACLLIGACSDDTGGDASSDVSGTSEATGTDTSATESESGDGDTGDRLESGETGEAGEEDDGDEYDEDE